MAVRVRGPGRCALAPLRVGPAGPAGVRDAALREDGAFARRELAGWVGRPSADTHDAAGSLLTATSR